MLKILLSLADDVWSSQASAKYHQPTSFLQTISDLKVGVQKNPISVRRQAILCLGEIVKHCHPDLVLNSVLHIYIKVANDTNAVIRNAASSIIGSISNELLPEYRKNYIFGLYRRFMEDKSRDVKISTFKQFGPFIFSLKG